MEKIIVASASVRNEIGQAAASIENMSRWIDIAKERSAELMLFPELNVSGYIAAPAANETAETVPGPSTDRITIIAQDRDILIAFGILEKDQDDLFCTHVLVDAQGIMGKQRKIHVPAHERPIGRQGMKLVCSILVRRKLAWPSAGILSSMNTQERSISKVLKLY